MRLEPLSCVLSTVIRLKTPLHLTFQAREGAVVRAGMGENPLRPAFRARESGKGLVLGVVNDLRHKYYELAIKNMTLLKPLCMFHFFIFF